MKVEYEKPWFVKPKLGEDQTNIVMNSSYTISLSFNVGENYKKDNNIGTCPVRNSSKRQRLNLRGSEIN
jgi:hypothetical protein